MRLESIQVDYQRLGEISAQVENRSEEVQQLYKQIDARVESLRSGRWTGVGAQAFFHEMEGEVLPALGKLIEALQAGSETVNEVAEIFSQAEEEAAEAFQKDQGSDGTSPGDFFKEKFAKTIEILDKIIQDEGVRKSVYDALLSSADLVLLIASGGMLGPIAPLLTGDPRDAAIPGLKPAYGPVDGFTIIDWQNKKVLFGDKNLERELGSWGYNPETHSYQRTA